MEQFPRNNFNGWFMVWSISILCFLKNYIVNISNFELFYNVLKSAVEFFSIFFIFETLYTSWNIRYFLCSNLSFIFCDLALKSCIVTLFCIVCHFFVFLIKLQIQSYTQFAKEDKPILIFNTEAAIFALLKSYCALSNLFLCYWN